MRQSRAQGQSSRHVTWPGNALGADRWPLVTARPVGPSALTRALTHPLVVLSGSASCATSALSGPQSDSFHRLLSGSRWSHAHGFDQSQLKQRFSQRSLHHPHCSWPTQIETARFSCALKTCHRAAGSEQGRWHSGHRRPSRTGEFRWLGELAAILSGVLAQASPAAGLCMTGGDNAWQACARWWSRLQTSSVGTGLQMCQIFHRESFVAPEAVCCF